MGDKVVEVEGIGKKYHIGMARSGDFRENFSRSLNHLMGKHLKAEEFWALKDISFDLEQGQAVGIIGKNGAGKSTLLKILSRITEPTKGKAVIRGRVSSLLEVGTGFHPELTGRENIFLNGTILGMTRKEVRTKFDEIVAFSGIEDFLDTPVKRYSSGMSVRLAFSVAAHLEPEIMIIDEVLAVGDADFQKKCIGKMGEVTRSGRTILFVSHNMAAVQSLCDHGILLSDGQIEYQGEVQECVKKYFEKGISSASQIPILERTDRQGDGPVRVKEVRVIVDKQETQPIRTGNNVIFRFELDNPEMIPIRNLRFNVGFNGSMNEKIAWASTDFNEDRKINSSTNSIELEVPNFPLNEGKYSLTYHLTINGGISDWMKEAFFFEVEAGDYFGTGKSVDPKLARFVFPHIIRAI